MNKKTFFSVMLVTVLVFGMTVVGCDDISGDGDGDSDDGQKIITVTGIPSNVDGIDHDGSPQINLYSNLNNHQGVAYGKLEDVKNSVEGSFKWNLMKQSFFIEPFTESGPYYLLITVSDSSNNKRYFAYTDGKTSTSLDDAVKYNVSSKHTIPFSKFANVTDFF
jgi:hypothetical protein